MERIVLDAIKGMIIGDAFGKRYWSILPMEFSQYYVNDFPSDIDHLIWSEKTSWALCVIEAFKEKFDKNFLLELLDACLKGDHWAMVDKEEVIPASTKEIIRRSISQDIKSDFLRKNNELADNFILLQVVFLGFYLNNMPLSLRYTLVRDLIGLSSPYITSLITGFYLEEFVNNLLKGDSLLSAYYTMQESFPILLKRLNFSNEDIELLWRLIFRDIWTYAETDMRPGEDSISTLEAALWVLFNSDSYMAAIEKAILLKGDTIGLGALVGALAGLIYGSDNIPKDWIDKIHIKDLLEEMFEKI